MIDIPALPDTARVTSYTIPTATTLYSDSSDFKLAGSLA
jgi:hypothetical protein